MRSPRAYGWLLLASLLGAPRSSAQPAYLVKDINPIDDPSASSWPSRLTAGGDVVYYFAAAHPGQPGLWRSDGTPDGTHLIALSYETELLYVSGALFFGDCQLWKTNGTAEGTILLKDFQDEWSQTCLTSWQFTDVDGTLFFVVDDWILGPSLWKSDGTPAGTRRVKRVNARNLFAVGRRLYFTGQDPVRGNELWLSDGTARGTRVVRDICPGVCSGVPDYPAFASLGGLLFFGADDGTHGVELWASDGSDAGTVMLKDIALGEGSSTPTELTEVNGALFFAASDAGDVSLWRSDGTEAGTVPLSSIAATSLESAGGRLFFVGNDGVAGREPWTSDGTLAGTVQLGDLCPGACSSVKEWAVFGVVKGSAFFAAQTVSDAPAGLWTSDGTPSGTVLVKNVAGDPGQGTAVRGKLFFPAYDPTTGSEVWTTDGTDVGTVPVTDRAANSSCIHSPRRVGKRLFFGVCEPTTSRGLWTSDGTEDGTDRISQVNPFMLTEYKGTALFGSQDTEALGLWRSDGTATGTLKISDVVPQATGLGPGEFTVVGGHAYFAGWEVLSGTELWKTDGTPAGTALVKDIISGGASGSDPNEMTAFRGALFFSAWSLRTDGSFASGLWRSDGTEAGTTLVKEVWARGLTVVGEKLYFIGIDRTPGSGTSGPALWRSDGTQEGTVPLKPLEPDLFPESLVAVNDTLFFVAEEPGKGRELWKSDGTPGGTVLVKDIVPGWLGSYPYDLTAMNGSLYFCAADPSHGSELWRSDGTAQGTVRVRDIKPGAGSSWISGLVAVEGRLFFQADDGATGFELWESDGTRHGTKRVQDLAAGFRFSSPHGIARAGSRLFFAADDGVVGDELWALDLGPEAAVLATRVAEDVCSKTFTEVVVTLSSPSGAPVTIDYTTSDGTATAGEDYVPVSGTLDFAPGITSRVIRVAVTSDRVLEPDEYFSMALTHAEGGILDETASTAAVWIEDRPQPVICR